MSIESFLDDDNKKEKNVFSYLASRILKNKAMHKAVLTGALAASFLCGGAAYGANLGHKTVTTDLLKISFGEVVTKVDGSIHVKKIAGRFARTGDNFVAEEGIITNSKYSHATNKTIAFNALFKNVDLNGKKFKTLEAIYRETKAKCDFSATTTGFDGKKTTMEISGLKPDFLNTSSSKNPIKGVNPFSSPSQDISTKEIYYDGNSRAQDGKVTILKFSDGNRVSLEDLEAAIPGIRITGLAYDKENDTFTVGAVARKTNNHFVITDYEAGEYEDYDEIKKQTGYMPILELDGGVFLENGKIVSVQGEKIEELAAKIASQLGEESSPEEFEKRLRERVLEFENPQSFYDDVKIHATGDTKLPPTSMGINEKDPYDEEIAKVSKSEATLLNHIYSQENNEKKTLWDDPEASFKKYAKSFGL
jgi:hypothetical protein